MLIRYRPIDMWRLPPTGVLLPAGLGRDAATHADRIRRALARRASQRA